MADAFVVLGAHVVKVLQPLFFGERAQHVDVAVRHRIGRENVVIRDDDEFVGVPDFRVLAELLLENSDGARPAHVVRHQDIHIHPNVFAGPDGVALGGPGQHLFGHGHGHDGYSETTWEIAIPVLYGGPGMRVRTEIVTRSPELGWVRQMFMALLALIFFGVPADSG